MKTAALLLASSASVLALTKDETAATALKLQQQTHELAEKLKHPLQHDAKLAQALKTLSGQPLTSTLNARVVSNSRTMRRSLRGKKGKGKGKDKGKDDDESEEEPVSYPRTAFQIQAGFCAGTDLGDFTLTEPHFLTSVQVWNDVCVNGVSLDDDTPFSFMVNYAVDENGDLIRIDNMYMLHDCVQESLVSSNVEPTTDFSFGGMVSPNGICTDLGGFGARVAVSETPLVHSAGGGIMVEGLDTRVNECYGALMNADYSIPDIVEYTSNDFPFTGGYVTMCHMQGSVDDPDGVVVPDGGSFMYDLSRCSEEPAKRVINVFTSSDCSGSATDTYVVDAEMCAFTGRDHEDFAYAFQNCWSGN
jgi:hypothetical protein